MFLQYQHCVIRPSQIPVVPLLHSAWELHPGGQIFVIRFSVVVDVGMVVGVVLVVVVVYDVMLLLGSIGVVDVVWVRRE